MFSIQHKSKSDVYPDDYEEGVVDAVCIPGKKWRVRVHDVYWSAISRTESDIFLGEKIRVLETDVKKLRLLIAKV